MTTDLNNSRILLSSYLWKDDFVPLEMDSTLLPENNTNTTLFDEAELKKIIEQLPQTNPEILKLDSKVKQLEVEKKLYQDKLKPNFDFSYKYLTSPYNDYLNDLNLKYVSDNYKIMLTISQPLFIRKERAKYQMSKIKVNQTKYELLSINRDISNLINTNYNEIRFLEKALIQQQKINENYVKLLQGEQSKFDNGESSIFMLNSRESKLIDGEIKLAELKAKLEKMKTELYYNAGNINSHF